MYEKPRFTKYPELNRKFEESEPMTKKLAEIFFREIDRRNSEIFNRMSICRESCQSPIEELMFASFMSFEPCPPTSRRLKWRTLPISNPDIDSKESEYRMLCDFASILSNPVEACIIVAPQVGVGKYVVDFMCVLSIVGSNNKKHTHMLAIECDGHDFHEKTKDQARRDKARDRFFTSLDIPFMRFTGSEVWNDAVACAIEVDKYFAELVMKKYPISEIGKEF